MKMKRFITLATFLIFTGFPVYSQTITMDSLEHEHLINHEHDDYREHSHFVTHTHKVTHVIGVTQGHITTPSVGNPDGASHSIEHPLIDDPETSEVDGYDNVFNNPGDFYVTSLLPDFLQGTLEVNDDPDDPDEDAHDKLYQRIHEHGVVHSHDSHSSHQHNYEHSHDLIEDDPATTDVNEEHEHVVSNLNSILRSSPYFQDTNAFGSRHSHTTAERKKIEDLILGTELVQGGTIGQSI